MSSKVSNAQRWVSCLVVDFAGTLAGCGGGSASKAVMTATPSVGLWDQPRTIVISHLAPGQVVTVRARTPRQAGVWTASATFKVNDRGMRWFRAMRDCWAICPHHRAEHKARLRCAHVKRAPALTEESAWVA